MIEQNKNIEQQETKIITGAMWKLSHNLIHKGFTDESITAEVFRPWLILKPALCNIHLFISIVVELEGCAGL